MVGGLSGKGRLAGRAAWRPAPGASWAPDTRVERAHGRACERARCCTPPALWAHADVRTDSRALRPVTVPLLDENAEARPRVVRQELGAQPGRGLSRTRAADLRCAPAAGRGLWVARHSPGKARAPRERGLLAHGRVPQERRGGLPEAWVCLAAWVCLQRIDCVGGPWRGVEGTASPGVCLPPVRCLRAGPGPRGARAAVSAVAAGQQASATVRKVSGRIARKPGGGPQWGRQVRAVSRCSWRDAPERTAGGAGRHSGRRGWPSVLGAARGGRVGSCARPREWRV